MDTNEPKAGFLVRANDKVSTLTRRFRREDEGIATLEFALIFPIFVMLLYAVAEFSNYTLHKRRAQMAVDYAVEFISRDDDTNMSAIERMNSLDIWNIVHPMANGGYNGNQNQRQTAGFSRSFAGIEFEPTPIGCRADECVFEPDVAWTFYWNGASGTDTPVRIDCDLEVVDNGTELNGRNIPRGVLGRTSAIMGIYVVRYKPLLKNKYFDDQDFKVSAIRQTRGPNVIAHPRNQGGTQC